MKHPRRPSSALSFLPALALAAAACLPAQAADQPTVVRFQDYPGHGNLLIRVAHAQGWCEQAGVRCELKPIPQAPLGIQALMGKSIDVAQTPIEVVATAVQRGAKVQVMAGSAVTQIFQINAASKLKLPHEAEGFPALMKDFEGKKIGVTARGSASESMFSWLMQEAGLKPDAATYVAVGAPNTAFAALRAGQVDAAISWEPSGVMCEITQACRVVFRASGAPQPALLRAMHGAGIGLVMRSDDLAQRPELARAVIRISQQAEAFVNNPANQDEVLRLSARYFDFDMPQGDVIARRSFEIARDAGAYQTSLKPSAVQATLEYQRQTGQLEASIPVESLVWNGAPQD